MTREGALTAMPEAAAEAGSGDSERLNAPAHSSSDCLQISALLYRIGCLEADPEHSVPGRPHETALSCRFTCI